MVRSKTLSTYILRVIIIFIGICALAICLFVLPSGIASEIRGDFDYGPIMVGVFLSAIPFFFALLQTIKLLGFIDKNNTFSVSSLEALGNIRLCSYLICVLYAAGMPYIFYVADRDDAPGVVALGLFFIGSSFLTANIANILQYIVQDAMGTPHQDNREK